VLKITNTFTGQKENFSSIEPSVVNLYVCGITPYDYAHIGHGRVYVTFDILYRLLSLMGYEVHYCRNFTDIDDKLLARAARELGDENEYRVIANKFIEAYQEDMHALNCLKPNFQPKVTECIPEIIDFVQGLIDNGKAYVIDGDVYYHIPSFAPYGKLSKQKLQDLEIGARVEENTQKKNPLDFALWKSEEQGKFWQSPWGWGRPGWAIECSAMAAKHLGKQIDIHAGGMDLIFPHHENEIAQSEGLFGQTFARYWMHNAFVQINKEKMSKSLGNFFTLRDVFKQFDPMVIRFYYLSHHYKSPLDFSFDDILATQKSYQKLCRALKEHVSINYESSEQLRESWIVNDMLAFLYDDLNTPGMLGVVFENLSELQQNAHQACRVKAVLQGVLGLSLELLPEKEVVVTPEMELLLQEREKARQKKNWALADQIRDQLAALGYSVQDKKLN
jgi:cysteinyl-tRNA synthetase